MVTTTVEDDEASRRRREAKRLEPLVAEALGQKAFEFTSKEDAARIALLLLELRTGLDRTVLSGQAPREVQPVNVPSLEDAKKTPTSLGVVLAIVGVCMAVVLWLHYDNKAAITGLGSEIKELGKNLSSEAKEAKMELKADLVQRIDKVETKVDRLIERQPDSRPISPRRP
jgi:hypothetical protein